MPRQPIYAPDAHALWGQLLTRQATVIQNRACRAFQEGFVALALTPQAIPRFEDLSARLIQQTGWAIDAMDGLLPEAEFFERLARRRFPVTWWLRTPAQADYIVEPDLFHDLVGHLPMLIHPAVGDFIQAYGQAVTQLVSEGEAGAVQALTRLYWFTIEFGLVRQGATVALYGAGLLSSFQESHWALDAPGVARVPAELITMMRQAYVIDRPQARYFVLPDLDTLWAWTPERLREAALAAARLPDLAVAELIP